MERVLPPPAEAGGNRSNRQLSGGLGPASDASGKGRKKASSTTLTSQVSVGFPPAGVLPNAEDDRFPLEAYF